jgi:hypothetical protein
MVYEEDLPVPRKLFLNGPSNQRFGKGSDHRLNRQAVLGGRFDNAHVAQADERHIERARDGSRRKRQHVHIQLQFLKALLVRHAEALLFVHHQQPQVVKLHVFGKQPVRPNDNIHLARLHSGKHGFLLARGAEAAEQFHAHGEGGEAAAEGFEMLEGQHRGGRQHGHLLGVADRLERSAHGHFGLAVAYVAAQQAVHGQRALHIALGIGDGNGLVGRLFELEGILKLALERPVG